MSLASQALPLLEEVATADPIHLFTTNGLCVGPT